MPIIANLPLAAQSPQVRSPLESAERGVRLADMAALTAERIQAARQRAEEAPYRKAQLESQRRKLEEDAAIDDIFNQTATFNKEKGDIDYDQAKASELLTTKNMGHLLPRYQQEIDTRRSAHRQQILQEAQSFLKTTEQEGVIAQNFLDLDEKDRPEHYLTLRRSLVQFDPSLAAHLPQKYDESVAKDLEHVVTQRKTLQSTAEQLQEADTRQKLQQVKDLDLPHQQAWQKSGGTGEAPVWFVNARTAKKMGVTAPPASTYRPRKLSSKPIPGSAIPENAVDVDDNPIAADARTANTQFEAYELPDGSRYYQQVVGFAKSTKEKEQERINRLYAFTIGKDPSELTPADEARAEVWHARLVPARATELDKRIALYSRDPKMYGELFGRGTDKPITPAQKATILGRINREISSQYLTGDDAKAYRQARLDELKEAGVDMGGVTTTKTSPSPPMKRTTNLPKPTAQNAVATDAVYQAYRQVYGSHQETLKAMARDKWK